MARQTDSCPHFGTCGGCSLQDMPYEDQLRLKERELTGMLQVPGHASIAPIVSSPEIWFYRNKMEYAAGNDGESGTIGLRQRNRFYKVVDLKECRIFMDGVSELFDAVKAWMKEFKVEPYHLSRHTGVMRYLALRHSKAYGGLMAGIVVALTPGEFEKEKDKFRELAGRLRAYPYIKSVYACLNKGVADVTLAGDIIQLYGDGRIKERVGGVDYYIYPSSFFQTNSSCCRRLYEAVLDAAAGTSGKALDIYCGSGGITLQLAGVFDEVTGVDNSEENIKYAAENAGLNGLENVRFVRREAEKFLSDGRADGSLKDYSVAVVDPPRSGLGRKAKEAIAADGAPRLVYVSCNPKTLADDLKELSASYKMVKLTPVDMFPHTHHLEAVASLERIRR